MFRAPCARDENLIERVDPMRRRLQRHRAGKPIGPRQ
jgi:hypothetical protein